MAGLLAGLLGVMTDDCQIPGSGQPMPACAGLASHLAKASLSDLAGACLRAQR